MIRRGHVNKKVSLFDIFNYTLMIVLSLVFLIPFWIILVSSLSDNSKLMSNGIGLWFQGFTFDGYKYLFEMSNLFFNSLLNSVIVSFASSIISVVLCTSAAYVLSRKGLVGRKFFNILFMIPMFFGGGTIALFLVIKWINLYNTLWALILPCTLRIVSILLMRNFFYTIPDSLSEAAEIDGANEFQKMVKVYIPLAIPMMMTIGLIIFVDRWNNWLDTLLYFDSTKETSWTIQYVLRQILTNMNSISGIDESSLAPVIAARNAAIVITVIPLMILSPMLHKYYVKGMTAGSVKQ